MVYVMFIVPYISCAFEITGIKNKNLKHYVKHNDPFNERLQTRFAAM